MPKFISKVTSSGWFVLLVAILAIIVGDKIRNRFWPLQEPARKTLTVMVDQTGTKLSVTAEDVVLGVVFEWDYLNQRLIIDNRFNFVTAEVKIIDVSMDAMKIAPHEYKVVNQHVVPGAKFGVEVRVNKGNGNDLVKSKYYVLGDKSEEMLAVGQDP